MDIIYNNVLSVEDYNNLRKSVGWEALSVKQVQTGINNSAYIVTANQAGNKIGMARVITDGGYVAYIADVIVTPEYQGKGIGKKMIDIIMSHLKSTIEPGEKLFVTLMAAKGKENFYKKFDFLERPNDKLGAGMSQWLKGEME